MADWPDMAAGRDAARMRWLDWDGCRLRWQVDAAAGTPCELAIDGIVFERFAASALPCERQFDYSPSGNAEIEFRVAVGTPGTEGQQAGSPWRVRYGESATPGSDGWTQAPPTLRPLAGTPRLPLQHWPPPNGIAVVVPIHNATDSVRRCLDALARWTPAAARLILIDDASTDATIAPLLGAFAREHDAEVECQTLNRGYTQSVNAGIERAGEADVVLLNSDTEVGPHWLQALFAAAYGEATIGTATAVSDNAGAFSVPELEQYCPIPSCWDLPGAQRAVLQQAGLRYPELPTGNGFCMYVKREVIARVGVMDAAAFPAGYGEENDFCQRAIRAGFRNVIAGNVLVRHERSASFGDARRAALGIDGMAVLRARYPTYEADVGATLHSFARQVLDYRVRRIYAGSQVAPAPRARVAVPMECLGLPQTAAADATTSSEMFALVRQPRLQLLRRARDVWSPEAEFDCSPDAVDADRRIGEWLLVHAIERVQVVEGGAWADRVAALAANLGIGTSGP